MVLMLIIEVKEEQILLPMEKWLVMKMKVLMPLMNKMPVIY